MQIIQYQDIQEKIIEIRNKKVILDTDVAKLYQVETKHINQAVKNNLQKFPSGYVLELNKEEWNTVKSKFLTSALGGGKVKLPNSFTEKGLYMLATILKGPKAINTTLAIIETFAKVRELGHMVSTMQTLPKNSPKQKSLMEHTGQLISDLIIPDEKLEITGTETIYEMNLAIFKLKRTVKKEKGK